MAHYNNADRDVFEDLRASLVIVRDHLDLLARIFHKFDTADRISTDNPWSSCIA
ncbi:MAG: hypothetical protein U0176_07305 [Bacteroidia bacterium]